MPESQSAFKNAADAYGSMAPGEVQGEVSEKLNSGPALGELGATGLKRSAGIIDEEFLPALKGTKGDQVFTEMSKNDPIVGALLFTIEKLLRQIDWNVVGADQSPEQQQAVEFVEECMSDMSHSWDDLIAEVLSMLPYGWSWHEVVYKKRIGPWETSPKRKSKFNDGKIGWRKISIRAQETLFRWVFDDDGGIKGMVQIPAPRYTQITIPIEKSLLFRVGTHKGNPEGVSILRNAYRPWYFKKRLEEFEAIGVERDLAGLPTAKVPSRMMKPNATPDDARMFNAFKKLVSNVRRDEHEGIVIPSDADPDTKLPLYEFELMSSGGSRTFDTNALIDRNSQAILMTVLADFIMVGHQDGGSYALHVDKTGIFRAALNSIAQSIADTFNRHAIPRLFAINGWKLDQLPTLKPGNVDPPNLTELGGFMTQMAQLGMTFFPDPDLEKFLRETAHLPELPEEVEEQHRSMAQQQNAMDFMQQKMAHQGVADQEQMVQDGLTPDQAQIESQSPHPDGIQGQAANQQMANEQQMADQKLQNTAQEGQLKAAQGAQQLQLGAATGQQKLQQSDAAHQQQMSQTDAQNQLANTQTATQGQLSAQQKQDELQFTQLMNQLQAAHDQQMKDMELQQGQASGQQQLKQGAASNDQKLKFGRQSHEQELRHSRDSHTQGLKQSSAEGRQKMSQEKASHEQKLKDAKREANYNKLHDAKNDKDRPSKFKR
jgi:hypothetical protein